MTTNTNRTAFANALAAYVNHASQADGKQTAVLFAMLEMETSFDLEWSKKFHTVQGKDRTAMIHATLEDMFPEFKSIQEQATVKASKLSEMEANRKEAAQNKVKALENLIRSCASCIAFFKLKNVASFELKAGRIRYATKKGNEVIWDSKTGETFKALKALGEAAVIEAKWKAPNTSAGKTTGNSGNTGTAADAGTSAVETARQAEATGNSFPDAFVKLCGSTASLIEAKKLDQLSEAEEKALRHLEQLIIRKVFADSKGIVDVSLINELYNKPEEAREQTKALELPQPSKEVKAKVNRRKNGHMTAAEAEALKAPNAVKETAAA